MIFHSYSQENTFNIAQNIATNAKKGNVYCLYGDLGTGKTAFVKGFANGLGIDQMITSPTFTIVNEYYCHDYLFYHFDVYRINSVFELDETGFYEIISNNNSITIIEWADLIKEVLPNNAIHVFIAKDYTKDDNYRRIEVKSSEDTGY